MRSTRLLAPALATASALAVFASPASAAVVPTGGGETRRADLAAGTLKEANRPSTRARISADGNFVVYQSVAYNLVPGDKNNVTDVFWTDMRDPSHPVTKLVSTPDGTTFGNGASTFSEISANGQFVVFASSATNLVSGKGSGAYMRDMFAADPKSATKWIAGGTRPVVSENGRFVAYNNATDVSVKDMSTGRTVRLTNKPAGSNDESLRPEISGDGTHVVFASDLQLSPLDQNTARDVYEADLTNWEKPGGTFNAATDIRLVSIGVNGLAVGGSSSRPGINGDGRVVSFQSMAGNVVALDTNNNMDAFVRDYRTNPGGVTYAINHAMSGKIPNAYSSRPQLDQTGDIVAFVSTSPSIVPGDTNAREDSFVRNWAADVASGNWSQKTFLLSATTDGQPGQCPGIANTDEGHSAGSTRPYLSNLTVSSDPAVDGITAVWVTGACNIATDAAHGGPDTNMVSDIYIRHYPSASLRS